MKLTLALLSLLCVSAPGQSAERLLAETPFHFDGVDLAPDGWLYFCGSWKGSQVWRARPGGEGLELVAEGLEGPTDSAMDSAGNLYITNYSSTYISVVRPDGTLEKFVDTPLGPSGIVVDSRDNVFVNIFGPPAGNPQGVVLRITPDGVAQEWVRSPDLRSSVGLAIDDEDVLFVLNGTDARIFRVPAQGQLEPFSCLPLAEGRGAGGHLDWAAGVLFASSGVGAVYAITPAGALHTLLREGASRTALGPPVSPLLEACNGLAATPDGRGLYLGCALAGERTVVFVDLDGVAPGTPPSQGWSRLKAGDTAGARRIFEHLARIEPVAPGVWMGLASCDYGELAFEAAAGHFGRAAAAPQFAARGYYNQACCLAQLARTGEAFGALSAALDAGFKDAGALGSDPDLASLRADPRWQPLVGRL